MGRGDNEVIVTATIDVKGFPSKSLVTLDEDLNWWAEDAALAKYMQALSPILEPTPAQPSRVMEMYQLTKLMVPSLNSVAIEDVDPPVVVPQRIY